MKKNLWILAAALCMTACSQNEDIVIEQPVTDSDFESPDGRLIIQLGGIESRIGASVGVTRAPLDKLYDDTDGATTQLGIFALATNDATNNTAITDANRTAAWGDTDNYGILLNNVQAAVTAWPQQGGTDEKPDGLENDKAQKITLYKDNAANGVYYYPMQKKYDYTFYGYAPYQADQTISAAKPEISFTEFDGSQDIIWKNAAAAPIAPGSIYLKDGVTNDTELTGYNARYIRQLKYHFELNKTPHDKSDYPVDTQHQLRAPAGTTAFLRDSRKRPVRSGQNRRSKHESEKHHHQIPRYNRHPQHSDRQADLYRQRFPTDEGSHRRRQRKYRFHKRECRRNSRSSQRHLRPEIRERKIHAWRRIKHSPVGARLSDGETGYGTIPDGRYHHGPPTPAECPKTLIVHDIPRQRPHSLCRFE